MRAAGGRSGISRTEPPDDMPRLLVDYGREVRFARADDDVLWVEPRITIVEPVIWADGLHAVDVKIIGNSRLPNERERLGAKAEFVRVIGADPSPHVSPFGCTS